VVEEATLKKTKQIPSSRATTQSWRMESEPVSATSGMLASARARTLSQMSMMALRFQRSTSAPAGRLRAS
jgi:hypothetical protein